MKYTLQCPRCRKIKSWSRQDEPEGPGTCFCGAYAPWHVVNAQECPECGHIHNSREDCDIDNYFPERDWGDL